MIKHVFRLGVAGCILFGVAAFAQLEMEDMPEESAPKVEKRAKKKVPIEITELVLNGTVVRKETERKERKQVIYQLHEQSGLMITLPKTKGIDLDRLVGQEVVVTGHGSETELEGKEVVILKKVTRIRPIADFAEDP